MRPARIVLTGFIIWCDWMGSNERDFSASPDIPLAQYVQEARRRATTALTAHQLNAARPQPRYPGFRAIFPEITEPRPLQHRIDTLPADNLEAPTLTIIEAPTGEGKTEAALALARRIAAARG